MRRSNWFTIGLMLCLVWLLAACVGSSQGTQHISPVTLEKIEGTDLNRVILTEQAAERLGIQTALVTDQAVGRTWTVGGEVVMPRVASATIRAPIDGTVFLAPESSDLRAGMHLTTGQPILRMFPIIASSGGGVVEVVEAPGESVLLRLLVSPGQVVEAGQPLFDVVNSGDAWVKVTINTADLANLDLSLPARIAPLQDNDAEDSDENEFEAQALNEYRDDDGDSVHDTVYYVVSDTTQPLSMGEKVLVEVALAGSGASRSVIPYSALIYDLQGNTWVYVNPEPLVFIRQAVTVDYILDELAVLTEGPAVGTAVATVGVAELYGADTGVGK